jgi:hypothetical protein
VPRRVCTHTYSLTQSNPFHCIPTAFPTQYSQVVVFHGETIAAWREQNYQEQEEHVNFRNLLLAPQADAQMIMVSPRVSRSTCSNTLRPLCSWR